MMRVVALALLVGAAAAMHSVDLSSVEQWDATPLVGSDEPRFAEATGPKCNGGTCAFATGVCCPTTANCCEWGKCTETADGGAKCSSTQEQNALLLAKAFAKSEAQKEVTHEQALKAKSEAGQKLVKESSQKNQQEQAEKEKATSDEATSKAEATSKHKQRLAKQEQDEEKTKKKESGDKRAAQKAMVTRFKMGKAITFNAGRPFNLANNKCWSNTLRSTSFTVAFWMYSKEDDRTTSQQNIISANALSVWTKYHKGQQRFGFTVQGEGGKRVNFLSNRGIPVHAWSHIVVRVTEAKLELLVNTRVVVRRNLGFKPLGNDKPGKVCAGAKPIIEARVSDLRFYNTAATTTVIAALYKARTFDVVNKAGSVETVIDGPWSPVAKKVIAGNSMQHSGSYSLGMWLKVTGFTAKESNILHKGNALGHRSVWVNLKPVGTSGTLSIRSGASPAVDVAVPNGKWNHFLYTHSRKGKLIVYINGKAVTSKSVRRPANLASQKLYVSSAWPEVNPPAPVIAANLVFSPTVLDAAAIREVIAKRYDHDYMPEGKVLIDKIDLSKDYKSVSNDQIQASECRTWAAWIKPRGKVAGWKTLFYKGSPTAQERNPAVWFYPGSTRLHVRSGVAGSWNFGGDPKEELPINVWSHLAIVHCHQKFEVYVNAQRKIQDLKAKAPSTNVNSLVAPRVKGSGANAELADVRYWTVALDQKMIHRVSEKGEHP